MSSINPPPIQNLTPVTIVPVNYTKNVSKDPWFWTSLIFIILFIIALIMIFVVYSRAKKCGT